MDGVKAREIVKSAHTSIAKIDEALKLAAMYWIKRQPFFGEYWQKPPSDRITIRRPTAYPRTGQWMG